MYAKDNYDEVSDAISAIDDITIQFAIINELLPINHLNKHGYYQRVKRNLLRIMTEEQMETFIEKLNNLQKKLGEDTAKLIN